MIIKNTITEATVVPKFITRVQNNVKIVNMDTLIDCSAGLAKRIKKSTSVDELERLRIIKSELDWLIDNL